MNRRSRKGRRGRSGCYRRLRKNSTQAPGRERFDTLLNDPRHVRGDLRLIWTAVRRGWLDGDEQGKSLLPARAFDQARCGFEGSLLARLSELRRVKVFLVSANVMLEMECQNQVHEHRMADLERWPGYRATGEAGRPVKNRGIQGSLARCLDARKVQLDLVERTSSGAWSVTLSSTGAGGQRPYRVLLRPIHRGIAGTMIVFVCPECHRHTLRIFPSRGGVGCARCAGLSYYTPVRSRRADPPDPTGDNSNAMETR